MGFVSEVVEPSNWRDNLETSDMITFGFLPEFIGRIPIMAVLDSLNQESLVRILTEPSNSLLSQYQNLFALNNVCHQSLLSNSNSIM